MDVDSDLKKKFVQANHVIKLEEIHKTYHTGEVDVHSVRGVSLDILPGSFVAIMGSSGSGKSTLMNMIGALDRPSGGHYWLDGIDVSTLDRDALADVRNEKIGFVFQGFNLLAHARAGKCRDADAIQPSSHSRARAARARPKSLDLVGLGQRADHHPNQLSGGQQQRVAIARALCEPAPRFLLADEPTGNSGQPDEHRGSCGVFQKIERPRRITIIMVTHELDVARYTKRMQWILRDGKIFDRRSGERTFERGN